MSNSLEIPEVQQVKDVLDGYENWRRARGLSQEWLSVSSYVDDIALRRQAEILQEIVLITNDSELDDRDFRDTVRILLGV